MKTNTMRVLSLFDGISCGYVALSAQVVSELDVIVRENFHRGAGTVNALIADHMANLANQ